MLEENSNSFIENPSMIQTESSVLSHQTKINDKKTKREKLLKLELTGDVKQQLYTVQKKLYKIEIPPIALSTPAKIPTKWRTTDELLYAEARNSYDTILTAFMKEPRVYKLESVKEKVWKRSEMEQEGREEGEEDGGSVNDDESSYLSRGSERSYRSESRKRQKSVNLLESPRDIDMKTFIDPFIQGDLEEIWKEKLNMLEKLTPRDDLNGYEYREDYDEQQYRIALINDFQDRLKSEIYRRTFKPTFTEQVEDCLYDIVEKVCTEIDNRTYRSKLKKKVKLKEIRHPAVGAYRIKKMGKKVGEEGQTVQALTDLEFVDAVITKGGYVLSQTIPLKVLLIHDHEREVMTELRRREAEERESMRRLPLTRKLRIAVLSNSDMQSLVRHIVRDIMDTTIVLPTQPYREKLNQVLKTALRGITEISRDPNKALEMIRDRMIISYDKFVKLPKSKRKPKALVDTSMESVLETAKRLKEEEDQQRRTRTLSQKLREEERDLYTKMPVTIPDSVLVKILLQYEPPSAYKVRPKRSFQSEIEKLQVRAKVNLEENKILMIENYDQLIKKGNDPSLQDYLKEAKEQINEKKKELYLEENIPVRKLVGSRFYEGFLRPKDLITKPRESLSKGDVTMVYDDSERKAFEETFLEEISYAACIPRENITIEQIRRLEVNSVKLKESIELKDKRIEENIARHKEEQFRLALKRFIRKAESKGIALKEEIVYALDYEPKKIEERFLEFPTLNNLAVVTREESSSSTLLLELPSSTRRSESLRELRDVSDKEKSEDAVDTGRNDKSDREIIQEIIDSIIILIEKENQLSTFMNVSISHQEVEIVDRPPTAPPVMDDHHPSTELPSTSLPDPPLENNLTTMETIVEADQKENEEIHDRNEIKSSDLIIRTKEEEEKEQELNLSVAETISKEIGEAESAIDKFGITTAETPKFFKLGLSNPSDMKYDQSYWFAKYLHEMDEEDRMNYRIRKLPQLREYYLQHRPANYSTVVKQKIHNLKTLKQNLQEDVMDYLEPFIEQLDPILEQLRPYYQQFRENTLNFIYKLVFQMKTLMKQQLDVLYNQEQFQKILQAAMKPQSQQPQQQPFGREEGDNSMRMLENGEVDDNDDNSSTSTLVHPPEVIELMKELVEKVFQRDIEVKRGLAQNPFAFDQTATELKDTDAKSLNSDQSAVKSVKSSGNVSKSSASRPGKQKSESEEERNGSLSETLNDDDELNEEEEEEDDEDGSNEIADEEEDEEEKQEKEHSGGSKENALNEEEEEEEEEPDEGLDEADEIVESEEILEESIDGNPLNNEEKELLKDNEEEAIEGKPNTEADVGETSEEIKRNRLVILTSRRPVSATRRRPLSASSYRSDESDGNGKNEKTKLYRRSRIDRLSYLLNPSTDPSTVLRNEKKNAAPEASPTSPTAITEIVSSNLTSPQSSRPSSALTRKKLVPQAASTTPPIMPPITSKPTEGSPEKIKDEDPAPNLDFDDIFWQRVESLDLYSEELISILHNLVIRVEENVLYDEAEDHRIYGCEITLNIHIKDEQRQIVPGLDDLSAQDIAYYLQKQVYDPSSVLNQGNITNHIVEISSKAIYEKYDAFDEWNTYWIHFLHPIFFFYSLRHKDHDLEILDQNNQQIQRIQYADKLRFKQQQQEARMRTPLHSHRSDRSATSRASTASAATHLANGMKVLNPIYQFNNRTQEAFTALLNRPMVLPPDYRAKRTIDNPQGLASLDDELPPGMKQLQIDPQILDLHLDEFQKQIQKSGLVLYRPNMEQLTEKDVQRCQRVYRAAQEKYDQAMKIGLEKNALRPEQYSALKFLQQSLRIYLTARQKLNHLHRQEMMKGLKGKDPFAIPVFEPTKISEELFETWIEEVRENDKQRLMDRQLHAERLKQLLKQEALLRRKAQKLKFWVMESFIKYYLVHKPANNITANVPMIEDTPSHNNTSSATKESQTALVPVTTASQQNHDENDITDDQSIASSVEVPEEASAAIPPPLPITFQSNEDFLTFYPKLLEYYCSGYYEYPHDLFEMQNNLRLELEKRENIIKLLQQGKGGVTNPDIIQQFDTEKEKNIEMKKNIISEEKKARKLFNFFVQWMKTKKFEKLFHPTMEQEQVEEQSMGFIKSSIRSPKVGSPKVGSPTFSIGKKTLSPKSANSLLAPLAASTKTPSQATITIAGETSRRPSTSTDLTFTNHEKFTEEDTIKLIDFILNSQFKEESEEDEIGGGKTKDAAAATTGGGVSAGGATGNSESIPRQLLFQFLNLVYHFSDEGKRQSASFSQSYDYFISSMKRPPSMILPPLSRSSFASAANNNQMVIRIHSNDDDPSTIPPSSSYRREDIFSDEEWKFLQDIRWIQAIRAHPPFADCLYYLPTIEEAKYQRDEIVQFASTLVDLQPLFHSIITALNQKKYQAEVKLGINKIKQKLKSKQGSSLLLSSSSPTKSNKKRKHKKGEINLTEEQEKQKEEEQRLLQQKQKQQQEEEYQYYLNQLQKKMQREKIWFMSHPHQFLIPRNHDYFLYFTHSFTQSLLKEKQSKIQTQNNFTSKFQDKDTSPPFCIICKQREYEYWIKISNEQDQEYETNYQKLIMSPQLNIKEQILLEEIEQTMKASFQKQAKDYVQKQLIAEGLIAAPPRKQSKRKNRPHTLLLKDGTVNEHHKGEEDDDDEEKAEDHRSLDESISSGTENERRKMEEYLKKLQVPEVNYEGISIIASYLKKKMELKEIERQKKLKRQLSMKKKSMKRSMKRIGGAMDDQKAEAEEVEDVPTFKINEMIPKFGMEIDTATEFGIKIRVFHRNDQGERSKFLGMIEIDDKIMRKPPKGIRTYRLQADPNIVDENEVDIRGTIAVMVNLISTTRIKRKRMDYEKDSDDSEEENNHQPEEEDDEEVDNISDIDQKKYEIITKYYWKLQIKKLTKITAIDSTKLSNPFCEIYYKGMIELPLLPHKHQIIGGEEEEEEDEGKRKEKSNKQKRMKEIEGATKEGGDEETREVQADGNDDEENAEESALVRYAGKKNIKRKKIPKKLKYLPSYTLIGTTKTNYHTVECEFNEKENHDYSYYDLPPVYTPMIIPSSDQANLTTTSAAAAAPSSSNFRMGGYVSKHLLPEINQYHLSYQQKEMEKAKKRNQKGGSALSLFNGGGGGGEDERSGEASMVQIIQQQREYQKYQELLFMELRFQLEIQKIIILNEEEERKAMAHEEASLRRILKENLFLYYTQDIQLQSYYAAQFQKVLELMINPSPMLQRLRFLMGEVEHPHHSYVSSSYQTPNYTPMTLVAAREAGYSVSPIGTDQYAQSVEIAAVPSSSASSTDAQLVKAKSSSSFQPTALVRLQGITEEPSFATASSILSHPTSNDQLSHNNNSTAQVEGMFSHSATLGLSSQASIENQQNNDLIRTIMPPPTLVNNPTTTDLRNMSMREYMFHRFKQGQRQQQQHSSPSEQQQDDKMTTHQQSANPSSYHNLQNTTSITKKKQQINHATMIIRCEDPSTQSIVHVIIIPLTNREDEAYLQSSILKLIGKYSYYLMKIIDFTIHDLNIYNAQGFQTVNERVGVIIKEYYHHTITFHEYLLQRWSTLANDSFRELLLQCIHAIQELHTEQIIHQNLTPHCFMIVFPNHPSNQSKTTTSSITASMSSSALSPLKGGKSIPNPTTSSSTTTTVSDKPVIKLDHYWMLENPRNPQHPHRSSVGNDAGRAEFGNYYTMPPEVYHSLQTINEKTDVFSFGVCVYYFATKGQLLPFNPYTLLASTFTNPTTTTTTAASSSNPPQQQYYYYQQEMEKLYSNISLKWGVWLTNLLRMCLAFNPQHRATIHEIKLYLTKRIGREQLKR